LFFILKNPSSIVEHENQKSFAECLRSPAVKELSRSSLSRESLPIRPRHHHRRHSPKSDEAEAFSR
jgi:hypothetical protein